MRVMHLSDIHIGVENYGRPATQSDLESLPVYFAPGVEREHYLGMSTRLLDFLISFDAAVDYAINHEVDLVLFAGDAYKNRDPSQTQQREFAARIARLSRAGITVFLTIGNHDLPHVANRATALEIFPTLQVEHVTVGDSVSTYHLETKAGPVQVVALPWIRIGEFMSRDESRNKTLDQIRREVEKRLTEMLLAEVKTLDPELPSFLCAHVTAAGAVTSSEQSMMLGSDHVIGISTLANPVFDYVALGHVHKHQVLNAKPMVVYPGSLERVDFSEENDTKGFCILEIDVSKPAGQRLSDFNFEPVNARRMMTIDIEVHDNEDPTEVTLAAILKKGSDALEGTIIRVRVELPPYAEPTFREDVVRRALAKAHYLTGIEKTVRRREQRTRLDSKIAEGLSPVDALKSYFQSKNISGSRERMLTELGERLIQEESEKE